MGEGNGAGGPQHLVIGRQATAGLVELSVAGEVDLSSVGELDEALSSALDGQATELALDLQQVTFMGSDGVRALVEAHRRAVQAGITLRVVRPSPPVARVLQVTGVDALLVEGARGGPATEV